MDSKYRCVVKIVSSENYMQFEIVSGRDLTTTIITTIIMAAGKRGPKRGNPAMRDEHTQTHC